MPKPLTERQALQAVKVAIAQEAVHQRKVSRCDWDAGEYGSAELDAALAEADRLDAATTEALRAYRAAILRGRQTT